MVGVTTHKRILLVDLSAVFWRNWHASKDEQLGSAFETTVKKIRWLASSGYDGVAVCGDFPPYFRKELSPDYKAQRDTPDPAAVDQLRRVKERLDADGFPMWEVKGYEADDVIASATKWAVAQGHHVHVASADKDLMALVCEHVQVRSTATDDIYDAAKVVEKFGVTPRQMPDFLALIGDKSDNVRGVPGVGAVKARDLLARYESITQLLFAVRAGAVVSTPAIQTAIETAAVEGTLEQSFALVSLCDTVPGVEWSTVLDERKEKPLKDSEITDADFEEPAPAAAAQPPIDPLPPAPETKASSVAIVARPADYGTALEPRSMREAYGLAKMSVAARAFGVANADLACAMILRGRALGLDAITSLSAFHVIKDKLTLAATTIEGMVMRSPECEYFMCSESTATSCTWITKRKGYPTEQRHTWTIEDAQRLGVGRNDQWQKQPRTMLRHRCGTDLARMAYPDVVAGLYSIEEMQDA